MSSKPRLLKFVLSPQYYQDHKKKTRWALQVAWIKNIKNAYKLMVGISETKARVKYRLPLKLIIRSRLGGCGADGGVELTVVWS